MIGAASGGEGIDRREFLRLAALGVGSVVALPLLEACSSGRVDDLSVPQPFRDLAGNLRSKPGLQVFPGAGDLVGGREQRFPFGMVDPQGKTILADARVWVGRDRSASGPFNATTETYARIVQPGDPRGFSLVSLPLPGPGPAWVMAEAEGLYGFSAFQVLAAPATRAVEQKAISVATPTVGHPRGVKNICTRKPACPMHAVSLDAALRAHKPIVFAIASPLLCSSRTCGPVVDEVVDVRGQTGDKALFIHAEPYKGDTATLLSPAAKAWTIPSEPWVWLIDRTGVVRARFEGPVIAREIQAALDPLI